MTEPPAGNRSFARLNLFAMPADLPRGDRRLLLMLGAAFFIGQYDMTLLSLALPDVQASFAIAEEDLGQLIAIARLGALPALLFAIVADRAGRRRLLMFTLAALALCVLGSGCATTARQFMWFQAGARLFTTLEEILAVVYALEMLPARYRGWGVGFLAAMGALGSGLASLLYAAMEVLPGGWRALYVIGALAILYIAWLRRHLPESPLFSPPSTRALWQDFWQPLRVLLRDHRRELAALALIAGSFWFPIIAALNFMSKYLQHTHAYAPGQVSSLFIVAGAAAILGTVLAGRVSDSIGRRPTLAGGMLLCCVAFIAFYNSGGWLLPVAWIAALFGFFAVEVMVNAVSGELFPTSCRSTAATLRTTYGIAMSAAGLAVEGALFSLWGSHALAISAMLLAILPGIPAALWLLRETARQPLR